ncbi:MAG: hypothetical protein AABY07_01250 [Nanoarchaeota archaeon]
MKTFFYEIEIGVIKDREIIKRHKCILRDAESANEAIKLGIVLAKFMFPNNKSYFCWINKCIK